MAAVYVNNLVVNAGSDFDQTFILEGANTNSALDLSGYTVVAQMRKWAGSSSATSFTATIISPYTSGKITLSLTSTQTSSLKAGRYVYDIVITDLSGSKTRVVEGMVLVTEGVTR
jgi:hypothetical protein